MVGGGMDRALARVLAQHRCFACGGVLVVFHLCPCCLQLVHPGCEHGALPEQQAAVVMVGGDGLSVEREEEWLWS